MTGDIDDVVDRLRGIVAAAAPDDGVRAFAAVYLATTEAVRDRLRAGFFADPDTVDRLDVVFAERFFAAADAAAADGPVPRVWEPLFAARADRRVLDVQFVLAGMNSHINHDLAVAVVEVCEQLGRAPDTAPFPADYFRVTDVLVEIEAQVRRRLLERAAALDGPLQPLLHLVDSWSLARAREAAWIKAQVLWQTRGLPLLHEQLVTASEGTVGMTSRHLLTPLF
jgi:uncharacterized protein with von Willebrand factor type A (vWA) domain